MRPRGRAGAAAASALVLGLLVVLAGPAWAAPTVDIRNVDVAGYPTVRVTVSAPGVAGVAAADLKVTENGRPVSGLSVEPLVRQGRTVDVVLAMDTSGSMQGAPLTSAVAAASAFVRGMPGGVRVGLLAFSNRARPLVAPTTDHARVLSALRGLRAGGETALFDAVAAAARMVGTGGQADVVLLSDGGDTVSRLSAQRAVAAVQGADVTVYAVGLRTPETDVATLRALAGSTGGRYQPAAAADLTALYGQLARVISDQYVISFRSTLPRGTQATVGVALHGAADVATVWLPGASPRPAGQATVAPVGPPLLRDAWGLALALALAFLAVYAVAMAILGSVVRTRRRAELRRRVATPLAPSVALPAAPGGAPAEGAPASGNAPAWVPGSLAQAGERVAAAGGFAPKLERALERADVPMRPGEFLAAAAVLVVLAAAVGALLTRAWWVALLVAVVMAFAPRLWIGLRVSRRASRLHEQLPDTLMILASALRAGHSFLQALDMVAKEIGEPGAKEFGRAVAEIRLGRSVDDAMNAMGERIGDRDFTWAVLAVNVQREVGGNLAEILEGVAETVRERDTVRRTVKALSAEGRMSIWILVAIPVLIAAYMMLVNPGYLAELFSSVIGIAMVVVAAVLMAIGLVWMKRIVNIDV